jgi:hypothetical protein
MADVISDDEKIWRSLTESVCEGRDKEARALLDENPVPTVEWFYFNALLRFRESGDCMQSRSALSAAFNESPVVAITLTDSDAELNEQDKSMWGDDEYYAQITQPAWQKTAGALSWVSTRMDTECKMFGAEDEVDEARVKKWQREVELADANLRRQDFKATKRSFKTALREADSLNDGGEMFVLTAKMLGGVLKETGDTLEDLRTIFDKKIAWLDKQESEDSDGLFTSYSQFAKVLYELDMDKQAEHCAQKGLAFFEQSMKKGSENLDFHYKTECLFIYACMLSQEETFVEAERCFSQLVSIQEEYLGVKHSSLVEGLMGQRFCLHQLKRHGDEKRVYDRLHSIDENFDADDEYRFVCDAALVNAE